MGLTTDRFGAIPALPFGKVIAGYLLRDQEQAWKEAVAKLNALDKAMDIQGARYVLEVTFGSELPLYWVVIPAKDVGDYYAKLQARMAERARHPQGARWLEIYETMRKTSARTVDQRNLTRHPALSLMRTMN